MFRNARGLPGGRDPLLPTSGNGRNSGGSMYGAARSSQPRRPLSKSFIATMIWALVSVSLMAGGWTYCSNRLQTSTFSCNHYMCKFEETQDGETSILSIARSRLVRAEMVRVQNGEIAEPSKIRRSAQRKLGYSYAVVYNEEDSEDDDDESYDSFEDDDDSYDSYDDDDESSEDDDPETNLDYVPDAGRNDDRGKTGTKKPFETKLTQDEKHAAALERETQREKYRRDRDAVRQRRGLPPLKEPDAPSKPTRSAPVEEEDYNRFPGDAGTIREKNKDEIRRLQQAQGMAAKAQGQREAEQRDYDKAARVNRERAEMDAEARRAGSGRPGGRENSPDDPDNYPPEGFKPERQRGVRDMTGLEGVDPKDASQKRYQEEKLSRMREMDGNGKGGGRTISAVGGLEEAGPEGHAWAGVDLGEDEAAQEGLMASGARRKLLAWRNRVKNVNNAPTKRTRAQIAEDARKAREAHRKGHGHHQKKAHKAAHALTKEQEEALEKGEELPEKPKTKHHHKAFHHEEPVPEQDRHHLHHGYHHKPGEEKIEHGWRHANRAAHGRAERRKLGTVFSLGRSKARARKNAIDEYANKKTHKIAFTDAKRWRAAGLWMMIVGCMSMIFCVVIGDFRPMAKTKKVS